MTTTGFATPTDRVLVLFGSRACSISTGLG
jgi:hypothetical protein